MKKILFVLIILASFLGFSENFEKYYREFITNNNFKTYITNEGTFVYDTDEPYDSRKLEKMPVRIVLHVLPVEDGKYVIAYSYIFIDEKYIDSKGYPLFDKINDYTEDADIRDILTDIWDMKERNGGLQINLFYCCENITNHI